jgi:basic amino acid/polyamine antiporter, APA family
VATLVSEITPDVDRQRATIRQASMLGYDSGSPGGMLIATIALVPVAAFSLIYPAWSVQQGGEIRRSEALRTQLLMILGAEVATVALTVVVVRMVVAQLGREYLGAGAYLFLHAPESLPGEVVPFIGMLHFGGWLHGIPLVLTAVVFNAWFWMWAPDITLAASRVLLAMSSDRLMPRWIGYLDVRARAPVKAIAFFSILCLLASFMYAYTGFWRLTLHAALLNVGAFTVTCVAAAFFPWTRRELYRESSAAPYEVFGVPVITILGAVFAAFTGLLAWRFIVDNSLALGSRLLLSLSFVAALYLFSLGLFFAHRRYRRRREGAEIEIVYREMPVD